MAFVVKNNEKHEVSTFAKQYMMEIFTAISAQLLPRRAKEKESGRVRQEARYLPANEKVNLKYRARNV